MRYQKGWRTVSCFRQGIRKEREMRGKNRKKRGRERKER